MGGGLMQLVAYGAQDIYLTGNPQITFFKVVYRRHTNFSMETIQQTISGSSSGSEGSSGTVTLSRNGDLIHKIYVCSSKGSCNKGSSIVKEVELEIGGQMIDKHWSEWNNIWNELTTTESKAIGLKSMQCDLGNQGTSTGVNTIQVPLNFWFCRNPGLALPLIALQYHEVKLKFIWGGENVSGVNVYADYIYLDTDERRRFAQVSHEYLIEQIQKISAVNNKSVDITLNHPIKELIWTGSGYGNMNLVLNGHDRFERMSEEYFQLRQPFDHHTAIPRQNLPISARIGVGNFSAASDLAPLNVTGILDGEGANTFMAGDVSALAEHKLVIVKEGSETVIKLGGEADSGEESNPAIFVALRSGDTIALVSTGTATSASGAEQITGVSFDSEEEKGDTLSSSLTAGRIFTAVIKDIGYDTNQLLITLEQPPTDGVENLTGLKQSSDPSSSSSVRLYKVDNKVLSEARTSRMVDKINVYSFGLKPEEHQPSGTCNFSRIDNAKLQNQNGLTGTIYAVNYNVLRIMSGMGGLAYSN